MFPPTLAHNFPETVFTSLPQYLHTILLMLLHLILQEVRQLSQWGHFGFTPIKGEKMNRQFAVSSFHHNVPSHKVWQAGQICGRNKKRVPMPYIDN
jgi:hypothetical protein